MKTIRKEVFETNSSSTHSLTIRGMEGRLEKIPVNVEDFDINANSRLLYNTCVIGELDKCRYLLSLIGLRMFNCVYRGTFLGDATDSLYCCGVEEARKALDTYKEDILNFDWLVWFNEVIKEKCNTTFIYSFENCEFPFILDCQSFEDSDLLDILGITEQDSQDKETMKELFTKLLFTNVVFDDNAEDW